MARKNYKYQVGQTIRVAPVISREELSNKYSGNIIWNYEGVKTEDFFGKTVQIKSRTEHCGGLAYKVEKEDGKTTWLFEDSLLPPSRADIRASLLNGSIDVPTFKQLMKVANE